MRNWFNLLFISRLTRCLLAEALARCLRGVWFNLFLLEVCEFGMGRRAGGIREQLLPGSGAARAAWRKIFQPAGTCWEQLSSSGTGPGREESSAMCRKLGMAVG